MPRVTAQSPRTGHYAANPTALPYSFPPTPLRTSRLSVETGAPMQPAPTRRLAAILLADIAGYSRLMERDEQGTHQRLRELRAEVTDPAIARHHGRFVRAKGDDLLVEFSSAVEALSCAVEIQRAMAERNRDLAPEARLQWRIGINLGDILVDGNDIAGDGVNVAARLEALAEPGGVAVSAAVREQVRQLSGVQMAYAGEHRVKNISRPIRVYKVRHDGGRPPPAWRSRLRKGVRYLRAPVLLAGALIAAVALWAAAPWRAGEPPRLSLAVLPLKGSGEAAAAAAALTTDASAALAHMLSGNLVAPAAAARASEFAHDHAQLRRHLNVRYVLEGEVTAEGAEMRLTARLVDTESGRQIWSSSIAAPRRAAEPAPLELLGPLVNRVASTIRRAELARPRPGGPDALELSLRGWTLMPNTETAEQLRDVRRLFEQALEKAPDHIDALAGAAYALAYESDRTATREESRPLLQRAAELSLRAISLGAQSALAWRVRAGVLEIQEQWSAAEQAIDLALTINPFDSEAHAQRGSLLISTGRPEEAVAALDKAIRLNPESETVGVHLNSRCRAELYLERYAAAIDSCSRATAFAPAWIDYMLLAAAYAMSGQAQHAAAAKAELLRREPGFTLAWLASKSVAPHPRSLEQRERTLVAGLRRAGVPEK